MSKLKEDYLASVELVKCYSCGKNKPIDVVVQIPCYQGVDDKPYYDFICYDCVEEMEDKYYER